MKIGVISDTHNRWDPRIAEIFAGVDEIWHLGDVCNEHILDECRAIQTKLVVVQGNNDFNLSYPLSREIEREGERFHLTHIRPKKVPDNCQWVLFGHTHAPYDEIERGVRFFNPGSATSRRGAPLGVAILAHDGKKFRAEQILL